MSKIEAELEAELERLGLNMNASTLQRQLSNVVEVSVEVVFMLCFFFFLVTA